METVSKMTIFWPKNDGEEWSRKKKNRSIQEDIFGAIDSILKRGDFGLKIQ
jgi:hypothetical protein